MAFLRFRSTRGLAVATALCLAWCLAAPLRGQAPGDPPAKSLQPPPPGPDALAPLRELLAKQYAKLQALDNRLSQLQSDRSMQLLEIRTAEQRLNEATARLQRQQAPPADGGGRPVEQRIEALEQQVAALVKEVQGLRQGRQAASKFVPVDFQALTNHKRKDDFHSGKYPGNNLDSLPSGENKLLQIPFQVGDGVLQLGSTQLPDKPEKITGIKVGAKVARLHFLHATAYFLEEEVPIGSYTIRYADGQSQTLPIVNAKDVTDWWKYPFSKPPSQGRVAWEGANEGAKTFDAGLWLFLSTWKNPRPDTPVASIDFASTMDTACAPFCVAITGEQP